MQKGRINSSTETEHYAINHRIHSIQLSQTGKSISFKSLQNAGENILGHLKLNHRQTSQKGHKNYLVFQIRSIYIYIYISLCAFCFIVVFIHIKLNIRELYITFKIWIMYRKTRELTRLQENYLL